MANNEYTLSTWPWESNYAKVDEMNPVDKAMSKDKAVIRTFLNHKHMIETIERYEWKNLPEELPSDLIERILFFRFKGALFKVLDRFIFLPFTLRGQDAKTIDSYGRYLSITPVLFTGQWKMSGDGEKQDDIDFVSNKSWDVVYDLPKDSELMEAEYVDEENDESDIQTINLGMKDMDSKAVVLQDSTLEISQDYTPMSVLSQPLNEQLSDILVLVNMDLINSAKVFYIIAKDEAMKEAIENEFAHLDERILNGKRHFVATSMLDFKELSGNSAKDTARYFQSYQSIDNLRKDIIGVDNGGTFMKQEHTTNMETQTNSNSGSAILNNGLRVRKEFCRIANKVFGLDLDVEPRQSESEAIVEEPGAQTEDRNDTKDGE